MFRATTRGHALTDGSGAGVVSARAGVAAGFVASLRRVFLLATVSLTLSRKVECHQRGGTRRRGTSTEQWQGQAGDRRGRGRFRPDLVRLIGPGADVTHARCLVLSRVCAIPGQSLSRCPGVSLRPGARRRNRGSRECAGGPGLRPGTRSTRPRGSAGVGYESPGRIQRCGRGSRRSRAR